MGMGLCLLQEGGFPIFFWPKMCSPSGPLGGTHSGCSGCNCRKIGALRRYPPNGPQSAKAPVACGLHVLTALAKHRRLTSLFHDFGGTWGMVAFRGSELRLTRGKRACSPRRGR